jgi:DNA-binding response OmpR family regulator
MTVDGPQTPQAKPEIFVLDTDPSMKIHLPILREHFHVTTEGSLAAGVAAVEYLRRTASKYQFLISDIRANAEETFRVFRTAKSCVAPPTILVTTADVQRVPEALLSGGDAVLLKPFPPNLLIARLGRLQQERNNRERLATPHSSRRVDPSRNVVAAESSGVHCPHCNAAATTLDFLSHRRAWYACLACKKVWIAKRIDW